MTKNCMQDGFMTPSSSSSSSSVFEPLVPVGELSFVVSDCNITINVTIPLNCSIEASSANDLLEDAYGSAGTMVSRLEATGRSMLGAGRTVLRTACSAFYCPVLEVVANFSDLSLNEVLQRTSVSFTLSKKHLHATPPPPSSELDQSQAKTTVTYALIGVGGALAFIVAAVTAVFYRRRRHGVKVAPGVQNWVNVAL